MYEAIITTLGDLQPISGKDRIVSAGVFIGDTRIANVIVGKGSSSVGVYFPPDLQLSEDYAAANDLIARYDDNGKKIGGGYFDSRRRVTAQKFGGVKSDGLWMPIESLDYTNGVFHIGDKITEVNGHSICGRYYNKQVKEARSVNASKEKISGIAWFPKHVDTEQLAYNLRNIPNDAEIYISTKLHGTSHRIGNVEVENQRTWWQKLLPWFYPKKTYKIVHGTRNVTITDQDNGGFYGSHAFRHQATMGIIPPVNCVIYGELIGWVDDNKPIMPDHDCAQFPELVKLFGKKIPYTYGINPGEAHFIAYNAVMLDPHGIERHLPVAEFEALCRQLGVPMVRNERYAGNAEDLFEYVKSVAEPNGWFELHDTGIHEGVVVRVEYKGAVNFYKYKSAAFKVMEGIMEMPTMEDLS